MAGEPATEASSAYLALQAAIVRRNARQVRRPASASPQGGVAPAAVRLRLARLARAADGDDARVRRVQARAQEAAEGGALRLARLPLGAPTSPDFGMPSPERDELLLREMVLRKAQRLRQARGAAELEARRVHSDDDPHAGALLFAALLPSANSLAVPRAPLASAASAAATSWAVVQETARLLRRSSEVLVGGDAAGGAGGDAAEADAAADASSLSSLCGVLEASRRAREQAGSVLVEEDGAAEGAGGEEGSGGGAPESGPEGAAEQGGRDGRPPDAASVLSDELLASRRALSLAVELGLEANV